MESCQAADVLSAVEASAAYLLLSYRKCCFLSRPFKRSHYKMSIFIFIILQWMYHKSEYCLEKGSFWGYRNLATQKNHAPRISNTKLQKFTLRLVYFVPIFHGSVFHFFSTSGSRGQINSAGASGTWHTVSLLSRILPHPSQNDRKINLRVQTSCFCGFVEANHSLRGIWFFSVL